MSENERDPGERIAHPTPPIVPNRQNAEHQRLAHGLQLHKQGKLAEAEDVYQSILDREPSNFDARQLLGVVHAVRGHAALALECFDAALRIRPEHVGVLLNRGRALVSLGRFDQALTSLDLALARNPSSPEGHHQRGVALFELGRLQEALESHDRTLELRSDFHAAWKHRGSALLELGRLEQALDSYDRFHALEPRDAEALSRRGYVLSLLGRPAEALTNYDLALDIDPSLVGVWINRGNMLRKLTRAEEALGSYERALALPDCPVEALTNRASVLESLGRMDEALRDYDAASVKDGSQVLVHVRRGALLIGLGQAEQALTALESALKLDPKQIEALTERGNALLALGRPNEARDAFEQALVQNPSYLPALNNLGNALRDVNQPLAALHAYDRALASSPDHVDLWRNRGNALTDLKRTDQALESYEQALTLMPDHIETLVSKAHTLFELKRTREALQTCEHALRLAPHHEFLLGAWLHQTLKVCDWRELSRGLSTLEERLKVDAHVSAPFELLSLPASAFEQRQVAEAYVRKCHPSRRLAAIQGTQGASRRIKLGYFSADLRNHPVARLTAGLFEQHDRAKFEVLAFSFGPRAPDPLRERLVRAFDEFIDGSDLSDLELVELARAARVDIAIDLGGHTAASRTGIFARRAAPIQVNYLGFPGTMGASYMDYIIGDRILIPEETRAAYTEKVGYLPHTFQANDYYHPIPPAAPRSELALPDGAFVFCCFNGNYKLNPRMFDVWLSLLAKVRGSVLWLIDYGEIQRNNLRAWVEERGIERNRLIFAPTLPFDEHLRRHQAADLMLDCLPFNGGTTTSIALRAGVPVVTCAGQTFAGRMSASLLHAVGAPDLVTRSLEDYETLAMELATNRARLDEVTQRIRANRQSCPLFDTGRFTRNLEALYGAMYERHLLGLQPDHLYVSE